MNLRAIAALALALSTGSAQIITTAVGTDWLVNLDGRLGVEAPLGISNEITLTLDPQGRPVIADPGNHVVVRLEASGTLRVLAGNGIQGFAGDDGPAVGASLSIPSAVAFDPQGLLYVGDSTNRIRRVDANGVIRTIAGTGAAGFKGDGGPAIQATAVWPHGMAFDKAGNLYFVEFDCCGFGGGNRIRKISPNGVITTIGGTGVAGYSGDGGLAINAMFNAPQGLAVDSRGNVLVADTNNNRIRVITTAGMVFTVVGTGQAGYDPDGRLANATRMSFPRGVFVGPDGGLVYADHGNAVVRGIAADGTIRTIAGNGTVGYSGDGKAATQAGIGNPSSVVVDGQGNIYLIDDGLCLLRKIDTRGIITTVAGNGAFRASPEGVPATTGYLSSSRSIALDNSGNLFVADYFLNRVRKVNAAGLMTTFAGNGLSNYSGDGGQALAAGTPQPTCVAPDNAGNVYICSGGLRKVDSQGVIRRFSNVYVDNASVDSHGTVYGASLGGHLVYKFATDGTATVIAGTGTAGFSGDGGPATKALLRRPYYVIADALGNIYISDSGNQRVRKISPDGTIITVAGNGTFSPITDNLPAISSGLYTPTGLALDTAGNLYIADADDNRVRKLSPAGILTTVAGNRNAGFSGDGGPPLNASLNTPVSVAVDGAGRLFIADFGDHRVRAVLPTAASFQLSATTASFSGSSTGPPTDPIKVTMTGSVAGLTFAAAASTANNVGWLKVGPAAGSIPTTLEITADPSQLPPGQYQGTVTVTLPLAAPSVRLINVSFVVGASVRPRLAVEPTSIAFAASPSAGPSARQIKISNTGGGQLSFAVAVQSTGNWLSVAAVTGTASPGNPALITVQADASKLTEGTYSGKVTVSSATTNETIVIPVTLSVTNAPSTIVLSQTGLTFTAVSGGGVTPAQSFGVLNAGKGIMLWSARAITVGAASGWLSITPAAGSTDANSLSVPLVQVLVNAQGLTPGVYYGQVEVTALNATNSPQSVLIVLNMLPPGSNPGPAISPTGLIFTGVAGGGASSSQTVQVSNITAKPIVFTSGRVTSDGSAWFDFIPATASIAPGASAQIVFQPVTTGLSAGIRRGVMTLLLDDGTVRNVNLLLLLLAPGSTGGAGSAQAAGGCNPTRLLPLLSSTFTGFTVPAAWPTPLEVKVVDDCAQPLTAGSVTISFSNGDPPLSMNSLRDGTWQATWTPRNSTSGKVTLTVYAASVGATITGSIVSTGGVDGNLQPPAVSTGGIVNSASYGQQSMVAPGALISIFGERLAPDSYVATKVPLSTELGGTSLVLAGRNLPLLYVGPGQINAIIPYEVPQNVQNQLFVQRGSSLSAPQTITIAASTPALFSQDFSGSGPGLIINQEGLLVSENNPVTSGNVVVLFAAGLGPVTPAVSSGSAAPSDHLSPTVNTVNLTIGGKKAEVLFAGLTPAFVGLYQVNAFVPAGVTGTQIPVFIESAGQTSNTVTLNVR